MSDQSDQTRKRRRADFELVPHVGDDGASAKLGVRVFGADRAARHADLQSVCEAATRTQIQISDVDSLDEREEKSVTAPSYDETERGERGAERLIAHGHVLMRIPNTGRMVKFDLENLSESGLSAIGSDVTLETGLHVFVEFFPTEGSTESILLQCEIARVTRPASGPPSIGLHILKMTPFTEKRIRQAIERLKVETQASDDRRGHAA